MVGCRIWEYCVRLACVVRCGMMDVLEGRGRRTCFGGLGNRLRWVL